MELIYVLREAVRAMRMPHRSDFLNGLVCCVHVSMNANKSGGVAGTLNLASADFKL